MKSEDGSSVKDKLEELEVENDPFSGEEIQRFTNGERKGSGVAALILFPTAIVCFAYPFFGIFSWGLMSVFYTPILWILGAVLMSAAAFFFAIYKDG